MSSAGSIPPAAARSLLPALYRLPIRQAVATAVLSLHLNWSPPGRQVDPADRRQRARVHEVVLSEGRGAIDIGRDVDGALPVDLWDAIVLPRDAWAPLIAAALTAAPAPRHRAGPTPGQPAPNRGLLEIDRDRPASSGADQRERPCSALPPTGTAL